MAELTRDGIPFLDLGRRSRALADELGAAFARVLDSGVLLLGPELDAFEREWAAFCGHRHAVGVASGTEALRLALVALGVERGDEVIIPALTAIPTAAAVCAAGGVPVPVDVDADTATIDPQAAEAAVGPRTRAAIAVHLYGRPAEVPDLGVPVVEDAAHAHGALSETGTAIATAYSFYPTKNLGGFGDGGAVVTDDPELAQRVARLRVHGRCEGSEDGEFCEIATNSRVSELEAAALRVGLGGLEARNRRRTEIACAYREAVPEARWQSHHPGHAYHLCVLRVEGRDRFRAAVPFGTAVHYPRAVPDEPAYRRFERGAIPNARAWAAECVSLPCFPELTDTEVEDACEGLREALA